MRLNKRAKTPMRTMTPIRSKAGIPAGPLGFISWAYIRIFYVVQGESQGREGQTVRQRSPVSGGLTTRSGEAGKSPSGLIFGLEV